MTEFARQLTALGYHVFDEAPPVNEDLPGLALKRLGVDLPDDYAAFLAEFPDAGVFDREVGFRGRESTPWSQHSGVTMLENLYGRCDVSSLDIIYVRDAYLDEFGRRYLAIGETTGANPVCISCTGKNRGRIYVWDHEHFGEPADAFYPAFDSFSDLINGLFEYEAPPSEAKLVSSWMSPELEAEAAPRSSFKLGIRQILEHFKNIGLTARAK